MKISKKIALIEDDPSIQKLYNLKLSKEGYDIRIADNGIDGLKLVEEFKPDLVLLDLLLPQMSGEDLLIKLREKDWGKKIKVLVLTNVSKDEAPTSLQQLGVEGYLVKALYTPAQVQERIAEILK